MAVSWSTNCPTRISNREKMTEEVFSWPSSWKWYGRPVMVTNLTHFQLRYRTRLILDSVARFTDHEYFHVNEGLVLQSGVGWAKLILDAVQWSFRNLTCIFFLQFKKCNWHWARMFYSCWRNSIRSGDDCAGNVCNGSNFCLKQVYR